MSRSKYAARPITNGSSGQVAQAATTEFKRIEQVLNDRTFPMPGMDAAYNAAQFPGATDAAKLSAAIARAVIDLVPAVWIPYSMLSYDTSAVTYSTAVHLYREGGPVDLNVWDPIAYGALGTNTGDDLTALDNCFAGTEALAVPTAGTGGGIVALGHYNYRYSKPLRTTVQGTRIRGTGRGVAGDSRLSPSYAFGPSGVSTDAAITISTVAGLTAAGGSALSCNATAGGFWFNLRDAAAIDQLNGATAFTMRGYFNTSNVAGSNGLLMSAATTANDLGAAVSVTCFYVRFTGTALQASCNLGGTQRTISGGTISNNTTYFWAFTYDGSTLSLYLSVPGSTSQSPVATLATSGNLVLADYEEVTSGWGFFAGPGENNPQNSSVIGSKDSEEIAKVCRHTGDITAPNGKFVADSNSLICLNWDEFRGNCAKATNLSGTGWLWMRDRRSALLGKDNIELSDFTIYGNNTCMGWIFDRNNHRPYVQRVYFQQVRSAVLLTQRDSYFGHYVDCWFQGPFSSNKGRYGIYFGSSDEGICQLESCQFDSNFAYPIMSQSPIQVHGKTFITTSSYTRVAIHLNAAGSVIPCSITDAHISTETGVDVAVFQGLIYAGASTAASNVELTVLGGVYETHTAPVLLNRNANVHFVHSALKWTTTPTVWSSSLALGTWAGSGTYFANCPQPNGVLPFSDTAGAARVGSIGKRTITFSATPTFNAVVGDSFEITLTANVTSSTLSNLTPGQVLTFTIIQDSTGGRTFVWPTNVIGEGTIGTAASEVSQQSFLVALSGNAYAMSPIITGM